MMLWPFELIAVQMNGFLHEKFRHVIVPDNPPGPLSLSGKLSRPGTDATASRAYFAGILTGTRRREKRGDLDYLVMISGPEPQRTRLEEILLPQIGDLDGSCTVLLGSPKDPGRERLSDNCRIIPFATTLEKEILMSTAKMIICRSGYTTVMELAELDKKRAIFIPTPGQTEQEYLSWYYETKNWFPSRSQYDISLAEDVKRAEGYTGFPAMSRTQENVERLYRDVFARYLEG
jgi:hypothetical protein